MLITSKIRKQIESALVLGEGPIPSDLMLIGERPGRQEAIQGRPFVGPAGQDLDVYLAAAGIDRDDAYVTNLVKTFAEYDKPSPDEIEEWRPFAWEEINQCQPRTIALLGTFAVEALMSGWWASAILNVRHGHPWRLPVSNVVVVPVYHPAYGLYDQTRKDDLFWDFQQLGKAHRGEMEIEYIDTLPSDDLVGLAFQRCADEKSIAALVRAENKAMQPRRGANKSVWGREYDHKQSDTFPEMEMEMEMEKRPDEEAF